MSDVQTQTCNEEGEEPQNYWYELMYDAAARTASSPVGQYTIRRIDNFLWTVEKTAKWSLPQVSENEEIDKVSMSQPPLVRPLPWILFLPALIALRLIRTALSLVALMVGKDPVLASSMVYFIQTRRRKLRALKYRGQKLDRIRRLDAEHASENRPGTLNLEFLKTLMGPLRLMICKRQADEDVVKVTVKRKSKNDLNTRLKGLSTKRPLDEDESDYSSGDSVNYTDLLDKYAAEGEEDSSFEVEDADSSSGEDSYVSNDNTPLNKTVTLKENKIPTKESTSKESPKQLNENNASTPKDKVEENNKEEVVAPQTQNKAIDELKPVPKSKAPAPVIPVKEAPKIAKLQNGSIEHVDHVKALPNNEKYLYSQINDYNEENFYSPVGSPTPENNENLPVNQVFSGKESGLDKYKLRVETIDTQILTPVDKIPPPSLDLKTNHQQKLPTIPIQNSSKNPQNVNGNSNNKKSNKKN